MREHTDSIAKLSLQSDVCIERLRALENEGANVEEDTRGKTSSSMSVITAGSGTAASVQTYSTLESIYRTYGLTTQEKESFSPTESEPEQEVEANTRMDQNQEDTMRNILDNTVPESIHLGYQFPKPVAPYAQRLPGPDSDSQIYTLRETEDEPPWTPFRQL